MRLNGCVAALLLLAPPATGWAQAQPPVQPGARVRLTASEAGVYQHVGTVVSLGSDTLVVDTLRLPLADITALERSRGHASSTGRGARIGGGIGLVAGGIAGYVFGGLCNSNPSGPGCRAGVTALGAAAIGAVGAGVGALIGLASTSERWEEVSLDGLRPRVVTQRDRRVGLVVSLRF